MKIFFITGNKDKIKEAVYVFAKSGIRVEGRKFKFQELVNLRLEDIVIDKAKQASNIIKEPFIVDDAGIFFEAYPNFPGVFTKYIFNVLGYEGILKLLKDKNQKAYFKTVVAYREAPDEVLLFKGICRGIISSIVRGPVSYSSPFNCLFMPLGCKRTFSEMSLDELSIFSHRAKALKKLLNYLNKKGGKL